MVVRGWSGSVATAVGVAAAVGAAQLGLGYGMNIISFVPDAAGGRLATEAWIASLTWATWIAATSTIVGAVVAHRLGTDQSPAPAAAEPPGHRAGPVLWRLVLATAGALGATVTVVLVAVPARVTELPDISSPQTVAAGYAALGVVVSLPVAVAALTARGVAANILLTAGWLWLLAVVAVTDGVFAGRDWARVPLAFWEFTAGEPWFRNILLPDAGLAAGAALLIGALAGLPAARRGDPPVGVVMSGAAGPGVLAAAYLLAQPDLAGAGPVDVSRHLVTPYLVLAGLGGSLLAATLRPRRRPGAGADHSADPAGTTGAADPTVVPASRDLAAEPARVRATAE